MALVSENISSVNGKVSCWGAFESLPGISIPSSLKKQNNWVRLINKHEMIEQYIVKFLSSCKREFYACEWVLRRKLEKSLAVDDGNNFDTNKIR